MIFRFSAPMLTRLHTNLQNLCASITSFFEFKQKLLGNDGQIRSIKMHLVRHSPGWISEYGSLLFNDSETWESLLKSVAKRPYRRCQKRKSGILDIMTDKVYIL